MLNKIFTFLINQIYLSHSWFLSLNDAYEYNFTDKELHFLVIGLVGMLMLFAIYPVFKWLANRGHIMTITWIYTFTLVVVLTFAIEIGQKAGGRGSMEFADIVFGVVGFLCMYMVFIIIRTIFRLIVKFIRWLISRKKNKITE